MAPRRQTRRALTLVKADRAIAFAPELERVLEAAAQDVARELGKQAAREAFEQMMRAKVS